MDCGSNASLTQTNEDHWESPKEMKDLTSENIDVEIGKERDINDVGDEAMSFIDSEVGEPDEGNSKEGDGEPNMADEIGAPAKEHGDNVAEEPLVGMAGEKVEEFDVSVGEAVEEASSSTMQEVEEDNTVEYLKVIGLEDCSVSEGGILVTNGANTQGALVEEDTVSKNRTYLEASKTCKTLEKIPDVVNVQTLEKSMPTIYSNDVGNDGGDVESLGVPLGVKPEDENVKTLEKTMPTIKGNDNGVSSDGGGDERLRAPSGKTRHYTFPFEEKSEKVQTLEESMPNIYSNDNDAGIDGGVAESLRYLSTGTFPFGFPKRINVLVLLMCTAVSLGMCEKIPLSFPSYQCCTFETSDSKMSFLRSNFSIKWGAEDICIHKPHAQLLACTNQSIYFLINHQNVKFCNNEINLDALIMQHGPNRTSIAPSNPDKLSSEMLEMFQGYYNHSTAMSIENSSPASGYNPSSEEPGTRVHWYGISTALMAVMVLCLGFYCWRGYCYQQLNPNQQNEDVTAEEPNSMNKMVNKETV